MDSIRWSCRMKHSDIVIRGSRATRQYEIVDDYPVGILLESPDQPILTWRIKDAFKGYIGICLGVSASSQGYLLLDSWYRLGHGHYLSSSGGWVYSHSDPTVNHVNLPCKKFNDFVEMTFNKPQGTLTYKSPEYGEFVIKIDDAPPGQRYYGCVYLFNVGTAVELVPNHTQPN